MSHQAPFYFYSSVDSKSENRMPAFPQHPLVLQSLSMYNHAMVQAPSSMPSTPIYTRPNSSSSQISVPTAAPVTMAPTLFSNGPAVMTPMASPRVAPLNLHKASMMLDTDFSDCGSPFLPSTPQLSSFGGSVGSPCEILQTPVNPMFSGFDVDGMHNDYEVEGWSLDVSVCASPPMTPVYLQSQTTSRFPSISRSSTDLSATSCPSLSQSPSPSPYSRSVSLEPNTSFCDPRNLTVTSAAIIQPMSAISTTSAPVDLPLGLCSPSVFQKSEVSAVRPRTDTDCSIASSLDQINAALEQDVKYEEVTSHAALGIFHGLSNYCAAESSDEQSAKRVKSSQSSPQAYSITMATSTDSELQKQQEQSLLQAESLDDDQSALQSDADCASPDDDSLAALPAPANRRGRKQSLTEDPTKTFVCTQCPRRFRRQEHLKRHFRSLHTLDKPFECGECGKRFSRSDNLAQHARTHGTGAIVMDLLDDGTMHTFDPAMLSANFAHLGQAMYAMAVHTPPVSDSSDSDSAKKKRKRLD
jgi:hypothetical protein